MPRRLSHGEIFYSGRVWGITFAVTRAEAVLPSFYLTHVAVLRGKIRQKIAETYPRFAARLAGA